MNKHFTYNYDKQLKDYFEKEIYFPENSFIACVVYEPTRRELHITFQKGQRSKYVNFPAGTFHLILLAQNKGSYILHHILNNKTEGIHYNRLPDCPAAELEKILSKATTSKTKSRS